MIIDKHNQGWAEYTNNLEKQNKRLQELLRELNYVRTSEYCGCPICNESPDVNDGEMIDKHAAGCELAEELADEKS